MLSPEALSCYKYIFKVYQDSMKYSFGYHFKYSKIPQIYLTSDTYQSYLYYRYVISHVFKLYKQRNKEHAKGVRTPNVYDFKPWKTIDKVKEQYEKELQDLVDSFNRAEPFKLDVSKSAISYLANKILDLDGRDGCFFNNVRREFDYIIVKFAVLAYWGYKPDSVNVREVGSKPSSINRKDTRHFSYLVHKPTCKPRHNALQLGVLNNTMNYSNIKKLRAVKPKNDAERRRARALFSNLRNEYELEDIQGVPKISEAEYNQARRIKKPELILPACPEY